MLKHNIIHDEEDGLQATLKTLDGQLHQLHMPTVALSNSLRINLRNSARKILCLLNRMDPTSKPDAVATLLSVRNEVAELKGVLTRCPDDLNEATKKLIRILETMMDGTLFAGASSFSHTITMHGSVPSVDVKALLGEMKPFLELAMDVAESPQNHLRNEIKEMIKSNEKTTSILIEQNAILKAQLAEQKAQVAEHETEKRKAQQRHLAYDLAAHLERVFAYENDCPDQSLYEGCFKTQNYNLEDTEKIFGITSDKKHKELKALTMSIRKVKEQRFSSGHSTPEEQKRTKLSQMTSILTSVFNLSNRQVLLYEKLVTYGIKKINEERKKQNKTELDNESLTVADIIALQDYDNCDE